MNPRSIAVIGAVRSPLQESQKTDVGKEVCLPGSPGHSESQAGRHRGAQHTRHQLCTEADAQQRTAMIESLFDQPEFLRQKGIGLFVESPNGRTQHNQKIGLIYFRSVEFLNSHVIVMERIAASMKQRFERTQVFKVHMANSNGGFHLRAVDFNPSPIAAWLLPT
jgi:hypothetical protein